MFTHVYTNSAVKEIYHIHLLYSKKMTPVGWKHKRYRVYNVFILRTKEFLETGVYNLHIYIYSLFIYWYLLYLFIYLSVYLFIYLFIYLFSIPELLKVG